MKPVGSTPHSQEIPPINITINCFYQHTTIEWDDGGTIGNKNKLILSVIFPSMHAT